MVAKKRKTGSKVKSLGVKNLSPKNAKRVKGGAYDIYLPLKQGGELKQQGTSIKKWG